MDRSGADRRTMVIKKRVVRKVPAVEPPVESFSVASVEQLQALLRRRAHRGVGRNELDERGVVIARMQLEVHRIEFVKDRYYERFVGEVAGAAFKELWQRAAVRDAAFPAIA
jgi:hypothetical protein